MGCAPLLLRFADRGPGWSGGGASPGLRREGSPRSLSEDPVVRKPYHLPPGRAPRPAWGRGARVHVAAPPVCLFSAEVARRLTHADAFAPLSSLAYSLTCQAEAGSVCGAFDPLTGAIAVAQDLFNLVRVVESA